MATVKIEDVLFEGRTVFLRVTFRSGSFDDLQALSDQLATAVAGPHRRMSASVKSRSEETRGIEFLVYVNTDEPVLAVVGRVAAVNPAETATIVSQVIEGDPALAVWQSTIDRSKSRGKN